MRPSRKWRRLLVVVMAIFAVVVIIDEYGQTESKVRATTSFAEIDKAAAGRASAGTHKSSNGDTKQDSMTDINVSKQDSQPAVEPTSDQTNQRYLFPIFPNKKGAGNNVQYQAFRNAAAFCLLSNRTLVLTPFFNLGGYVRDISKEEQNPFNETFDETNLKSLLPVTTVETFLRHCSGNLTVFNYIWRNMMRPVLRKSAMSSVSVAYRDVFNIELPDFDDTIRENKYEMTMNSNITCLCLLDYFPNRPAYDDKLADALGLVNAHLKKAQYIRHAVDSVTMRMCNGNSFLAFHWRNKSGEISSLRGESDRTEYVENAMMANELVPNITHLIVSQMNRYSMGCVYVAHPTWSSEIIDYLSSALPRHLIYDSSDIFRLLGNDGSDVWRDDYKLSLLEQEICLRADMFIGTSDSSWSVSVVTERNAMRKKSFYLTEIMPDAHSFIRGFRKFKT